MNFRQVIQGVILGATLFSMPIHAEDEIVNAKDVNRIMQQILDQHVEKKQVTSEIIRNSFKIYIDQFDPERIYLLEDEVSPYLNMSDAKVVEIMKQYEKSDLSSYVALNAVIVKAIQRAESFRSQMKEQDIASKSLPASYAGGSFAKTEIELKKRQYDHMVQFVQNQQLRYGPAYIQNNAGKLLVFYDKKQRQFENQYLPLTLEGAPLAKEAEENQFLIHVLKSLAKSLDAHTAVLDNEEAYDMRTRLNKGIEGVGIDVEEKIDGIFIKEITKDGPAAKSSKVQVGDQLLKINGVSVDGMDLGSIQEHLAGQAGTKLNLTIAHTGNKTPIQIDLVRDTIVINEGRAEVTYESFGNGIIGKIKLDSFYQGPNGISSVSDVKKAIQELDSKGNLRGLILDFRENTGGFLSQAIKVAGLFITNGVVVISKYQNGEEHFYRDMDTAVSFDGPLIILTSKATASAAEIVAQALQDYGVAVVVGDERTYGKGTIQSQTITRDDGSSSYFKVTVGTYYTVSGKTPQLRGVQADVVVPSRFSQLALGEEYLDNAVDDTQKPIDSAYNDSLQDIQPSLKTWYMRYYTPTVQQPRTYWKAVMPQLRKNSEYRIAHNKNYQMFLKQLRGEKTVSDDTVEGETDEYGRMNRDNFGKDDLEMQEAVNVLKDMIYLEPQADRTIQAKSD